MLERPSESHDDGKTAGYFPREMRSLLNTLDYHAEPLYIGKKTPPHNRGYKWEVHVVLYEKPRGTGECHVHRVHHASTPRATFTAGIRDATHQVLMVLWHQEYVVLRRTQYRHFLLKVADDSEVHVNDNVRNNLTGQLREQVRLPMAMDHALSEVMLEIEELHKRYDKQEQVIMDNDDFIVEMLAKINNEDSDSDPDYDGDDDGGADENSEEDSEEVPEGDAP
jgi:hypothetical protein